MYTLEITKHGYYDLIDEFGIIAAGSKDLVELINTLPHGETIVKGKSMVVDSMESIYDEITADASSVEKVIKEMKIFQYEKLDAIMQENDEILAIVVVSLKTAKLRKS